MSVAAAKRPVLKKLECPSCGAPIAQYSSDTQSVVCGNCGAYLALEMGAPTQIGQGRKLSEPSVPIAIGDIAQLDGTNFFVMGRVIYKGWDDEDKWTWTEWLMGGDDGRLLWLSYSDDEGFTLFRKLRVRTPFDATSAQVLPVDGGKVLVHERYPAQIMGAEGELTWRAKPGDELTMIEAFGSGKHYSVQHTPEELEMYEGVPLKQEVLAKAFNKPQWLNRVQHSTSSAQIMNIAAGLCIVFAIYGVIGAIWAAGTGETFFQESVTVNRNSPVVLPVEISQPERVMIVSARAMDDVPMANYVDIDVSITSPDETENDLFTIEFWQENGIDEGEYWEEAQLSGSDMFVPFQAGTHELEIAIGESTLDSMTVDVNMRQGHVLPTWFLVYSGVTVVIAIVLIYMAYTRRVK